MRCIGHTPAPWGAVLALALALAWALPGTDACLFDPQKPNEKLTWGESYQLRVTGDGRPGGISSFALFFYYFPNAVAQVARGSNVTILQLNTQERADKPLTIRNSFNLKFKTKYKGKLPYQPPGDTDVAPNFAIATSGLLPGALQSPSKDSLKATFKGDACSVNATLGGVQLTMRCTGPPQPLGPNMESIEGFLSALNKPLQYFIHSLGTPVEYTLRQPGGKTLAAGKGYMHADKNWGDTFPETMMYALATSADGKAAFALGGGPVPPSALPIPLFKEVWYLAVQIGKEKLSMRVWDPATFVWKLDTCDKTNVILRMTATAAGAGRQVEITIKAPRRSFSPSPVVNTRDKVRNLNRSFLAEAQVRLYALKNGSRTQVASQNFKNILFESENKFLCQS